MSGASDSPQARARFQYNSPATYMIHPAWIMTAKTSVELKNGWLEAEPMSSSGKER
ncbi:MAG: hypothetical protein JSS49_01605 [Planctomycetes bacterium]|nr:hypothetical protein [Planctomycetota bacterium]